MQLKKLRTEDLCAESPSANGQRSGWRRFWLGCEDPRRLALLRIFYAFAILISTSGAMAAAAVLTLIGVAGRWGALAIAGIAVVHWRGEDPGLSTARMLLLCVPSLVFFISRPWDVWSLESLFWFYYAGENDPSDLRRRAELGLYRWPLRAIGLFAAGWIAWAAVTHPAAIGDPSLMIHALWIAPLLLPLPRALDAIARGVAGLYPAGKRQVIYDGDCGFCTRTVMVIARWNALGLIEFVNYRQGLDPVAPDHRHGVALADCERELQYCNPRAAYGGFFAFRALARALPIAWPVLALLYLPGAAWTGVRVYRWVAAGRMGIRLRNMDRCHLDDPEARP